MKITQTSSRKKRILIIVASVAVVAIGVAIIVFSMQQRGQQPTSSQENKSSEQSTTPEETTPSQPQDPSPEVPPAQTPPTQAPSNDESVVVSPATPPAKNENFPVENAHYRIDKKSNTSFEITLYAILNNTSQRDEYTEQLRQFKKEALQYLADRYGSTGNFTFTWTPPEAKDL